MHATAEIDTRTRENAHERSWNRHANTDNCARAQDVATITLQPPNAFVYLVSSTSRTRAFLTVYGSTVDRGTSAYRTESGWRFIQSSAPS